MSHELRPTPLDLATTQAWVQAVVTDPGEIDDALTAPAAATFVPAEQVERVIRPSHSLTAQQRIGIYHGMYLLRMQEALQSDYPAVAWFLGEQRFERLVRDYVQRHPSRSYTLNRLGDHLPSFLQTWRPDHDGKQAVSIAPLELEFVAELAALELAITGSFDAEESAHLDAEQLAAIPPDQLVDLCLAPAASLRLISSRFELGAHLDAARERRGPLQIQRRERRYCIFRRDYSVRRLALGAAEYALLEEIVAGTPLGEAIERSGARHRVARSTDRVFTWFRKWVAFGWFASPELKEAVSVDGR